MSKNSENVSVYKKDRRVYPYKKRMLVCFKGQRYISGEESALVATDLNAEKPFYVHRIEVENESEGQAPLSITAVQRRPGKSNVTETLELFEG